MPAATRNPMRPKVKASAKATVATPAVAYALRLVGVHIDDIPAEVLLFAAGSLATAAAYLKHDGLRGAWERIVNGDPDT